MKEVSHPELELLSVARAVMGLVPLSDVEPLLIAARPPPEQLGPTAMALFEDTLARGGVLWLMRAGGGFNSYCLEQDKVRTGRIWERHSPPVLQFSAVTFQVLRWLIASRHRPLVLEGSPTPADELFLYAAFSLLARSHYAPTLERQPVFRTSVLCSLGFAAQLGGREESPTWDLAPLTLLLEALQKDFARQWLLAERAKSRVFQPSELERIGNAQEQVLTAFFDAANRIERRDLCGFLIDTASALLAGEPSVSHLVGSLDPDRSLAERQRARHAAGATLRALSRLARWHQEHGAVRFMDDNYAAAQRLAQEWNRLGERGFRTAEALHQELTAL